MRALAGVVAFVALLAAIVAAPLLYLAWFGVVVPGTVVRAQERYDLVAGGRWRHVYEVTYDFHPLDGGAAVSADQWVAPAAFAALRSGATIQVRYNPWSFFRHVRSYGSAIEGTSTWIRFFPESDDIDGWDLGAVAAAALLAALAWLTGNLVLIFAATLAGTLAVAGILLMGAFAFPIVFLGWRSKRWPTAGVALTAAMLLTAPVIKWRIPAPPPAPQGRTAEAVAEVRDVRTVTNIWPTYRRAGQYLPVPFDLADLVFTPAGSAESIHVIDRVDSGSVAGLVRRGHVPVVYEVANPRVGRLAGGSRAYGDRLLTYLLELTFGIAAGITFVLMPLWVAAGRLFRRMPAVRNVSAMQARLRELAALPEDDPRRRALEELANLPQDDSRRAELVERLRSIRAGQTDDERR